MDERLYSPFINSIKAMLNQMASIEVEPAGAFYSESDDIISYGVTSIISFAGNIKGRLLLDMEEGLAMKIAENINMQSFSNVRDYMVLASISELNNIVSGDAITALNNSHSLGLRLAPPIVFAGKGAAICIPKISSVSLDCTTKHGKLKLNVAFERGL
ncbi:MAG: chemotaxis protein CheX [Clostridia bacterium]|nr:chemotaxis protein CheX [Clostridia bacterium]